MTLYRQRWGDADGGAAVDAPPSTGALVGGAALGIVPFLIVAVFFWAALASPPAPQSSYRGRKH